MKNTRSTIKLLLLSLAFAAVHITASPMQWIVQPKDLSTEQITQATLTLQEQISASLVDQRKVQAGWFLAKPKETVESFFAANSAAQVLRALLNLREYTHASNHLQNFLNRKNDDAAKRHAYNFATNLGMEGSALALYQLTHYLASCVAADRSLMSQEYMDNVVTLALMGSVATEQASIWFTTNFADNQELMARVAKSKAALQAKYAQFIQIVCGQEKLDDAYLASQWANAYEVIANNSETARHSDAWIESDPVWLALVTFDRYQNLGFDLLTQDQAVLFNIKDANETVSLDRFIQALQQTKANLGIVAE